MEVAPVGAEPYASRREATAIGRRLGAALLGASLYELPPGEKTWPHIFTQLRGSSIRSAEALIRQARTQGVSEECPPGPGDQHEVGEEALDQGKPTSGFESLTPSLRDIVGCPRVSAPGTKVLHMRLRRGQRVTGRDTGVGRRRRNRRRDFRPRAAPGSGAATGLPSGAGRALVVFALASAPPLLRERIGADRGRRIVHRLRTDLREEAVAGGTERLPVPRRERILKRAHRAPPAPGIVR